MTAPDAMLPGSMALPDSAESRFALLCEVAGVLAEHGVKELTVSDPRSCRSWSLHARASDLPTALHDAAAGTSIDAPECHLLITKSALQWHAAPEIHGALARLG